MKKKTVKKKYPSIRKNATFNVLWDYYRRVQKDFLKAVRRHRETKKAYLKLKADKNTHKAQLKAWKEEVKRAKQSKALLFDIVKDARRHVKRWLKAYHALYDLADNRSSLTKAAKWVKEEKPKKAKTKKATKAKAKKKSAPKADKKANPKPKAAAPKPKLVIAKKVTLAKTAATKPATPKRTTRKAATPAKPKAAPKPAAKRPARKTTTAAKPKAAPKPAAKRPVRKTATTRRAAARRDNLKRVEGIGVKIEQLLRNAGIDSFEKLSKATKTTLRKLLDGAGPHYRVSDPTTWARQARMAAQGKWEELKKWQGELKGGRIVK